MSIRSAAVVVPSSRALASAGSLLLIAGMALAQPAGDAPAKPAEPTPPAATPATPATAPVAVVVDPEVQAARKQPTEGQTFRVAGGMDLAITRRGDSFLAGRSAITTPLPVGYPDPTPPGAIDIKRYPSVRRAEITGSVNPAIGMNVGFFPLFNHIKRREIEMTSPVEMNYQGLRKAKDDRSGPQQWTMSFLYRSADLGPIGDDERDQRVKVVDIEPVTVVAIGFKGGYGLPLVMDGVEKLDVWLAQNPQWEATGEPRSFFYNGPEMPNRDKWGEVQVPIRPKAPAPAGADAAPKADDSLSAAPSTPAAPAVVPPAKGP
jgi:hypothetical protein